MDRRTFLTDSALGSATALAGLGGAAALSGCGAAGSRPTLGAVESLELLTRLERGLSAIRDIPIGTMAAAIPWQVRPEHHETILRMGLESLVVADVNRSVPTGVNVSGELAARIAAEVPLLERAVGTYHALLTRMPPAARRNIDRRLRREPDAAMETAEWIDGYAGTMGVAPESRLLMRNAATNVGTRMRRQSASAVIDDSIAKVERAIARSSGALTHATSATTFAMIDAIWQTVEGAGGGSATSAAPASTAVPASYSYTSDPAAAGGEAGDEAGEVRWNERWARPGDHNIEVGAILMPFGLITCTILLWVGLGILISGVSRNNNWDGMPEPLD